MTQLIKRLPLDRSKRHLVVGDIHGRYETFLNLLAAANYDHKTDILYSVGDLIDRGPKSFEVVDFFKNMKNVYHVMGNHEYMATDPRYHGTWLANGGYSCQLSLSEHRKDEKWLTDYFKTLPWVIEVGDDNEDGAFRVLHAEYPIHWGDNRLTPKDEYDEIDVDETDWQTIIWSRALVYKCLENVSTMKPALYGIDVNPDRHRHNFVGHTPIHKVLKFGDHTFCDTWQEKTMSIVDALTGESFTVEYADDII